MTHRFCVKRCTGWLLVALVVCLSGFVYFWVSGDRSWLIGTFGAVLLFGIGMIVAVYLVHSANMKRKLKDMGAPEATFNATETSFSVASGAGSSTIPWLTCGSSNGAGSCCSHKEKPPPKKPPTLREITRMLASLGGFLGRKGDSEPGTQTIWIGYTNLLSYIKAINLVTTLR